MAQDYQQTPPRRRLADLLQDVEFLLVQLVTFHQSTGPHHTLRQQEGVVRLHRRLDGLEHKLRLRANELGDHEPVTLGQLRRRLSQTTGPQDGKPERRESAAAQAS